MLKTLHFYFARELFKTFALTLVALTILVTMGGGVANVFRNQGVDVVRAVKIFLLLVPVAVTLVLPVAALFSATITYGRASADNEINACRAAGINILTLLLSPALLGAGSAGLMYYSWNYVIPGLSAQVFEYGKQDFATILVTNLRRGKGFSIRNYALYADSASEVPRDQLPPDTPASAQYILLKNVAFLETAENRPMQCGTTERAIVNFDTSGSEPQVEVDLQGVRTFDFAQSRYLEVVRQPMGPIPMRLPMGHKLRFEDRPTLLHYAREPQRIPELVDKMRGVRAKLLRTMLYQDILAAFDPNQGGKGSWKLAGPGIEFTFTAEMFTASPDDWQPQFQNVTVVEEQTFANGQKATRRIHAKTGAVRMHESLDARRPMVQIELGGGVEWQPVPMSPQDRVVKMSDDRLRGVPVPRQVQARLDAVTDAQLLDPRYAIHLPPRAGDERRKLYGVVEQLRCEVVSNIQFRSSYAAGTIPVVLLGALLGIVLRGGQVLTAFGISCIPSLVVAVGIILGRNFAGQPGTHTVGIALMWAFDGLLAAGMAYIATRVLRR
ncbi:MAG: LptF/LptG family permease [Phycisphaerae bacterium]